MANKAQKFLLDHNCGDLILNDFRATKPEDRIYASDIMMMFLEGECGQNVNTSERQLTIPDVSNRFSPEQMADTGRKDEMAQKPAKSQSESDRLKEKQ